MECVFILVMCKNVKTLKIHLFNACYLLKLCPIYLTAVTICSGCPSPEMAQPFIWHSQYIVWLTDSDKGFFLPCHRKNNKSKSRLLIAFEEKRLVAAY